MRYLIYPTTLDDLEGHYCVFDMVTISTEVYLFIILCDNVCLRKQHCGCFWCISNNMYVTSNYTSVGEGRKVDMVLIGTGKGCNNMTVKTGRNSCGIARFPCGSTAFLYFYASYISCCNSENG